MRTYVTGASGFLGSYLIKKLSDPLLIPHNQIHTIKPKEFNYFYFLSSYGNLSTQSDDKKIIKANVNDLIDILLQIKWDKVKSFVFISSSSVTLPIQTMYSRTKRAAEEILLPFAQKYKAPICIIRPFTVTGIGEQDVHLIPRLIDSCLNGTPLEFTGNPKHDYIDARDVADGILALSKAGAKGIFELGTGKSYSNQEVLGLVEKLTGKKANIKPGKARLYDTEKWISRDFKARDYNWAPKIKLEETLREMINNYEKVH
jgi:nucleoside-diphosphate-sugar epimerase